VLCVALGNGLNYHQPLLVRTPDFEFNSVAPTHTDLKTGYHSLCLSNSGDYIVFSADQVKCCAFAKVPGGANIAESTELDHVCDLCGKAEVIIWCINCGAKLCTECDDASHKVNAVLSRHTRVSLAEGRSLMDFRRLHPKSRVEYSAQLAECQFISTAR
jgi:hypothetical protein